MKKKLAITSIVVLVLAGCSANDFSPEVVIPKAINSIVKTKNKLYLSSNKKFLEGVLKKQDITEEEYNKLKELLSAAKVAKDYSTVKRIASFEPFKKRVELEKSVNRLLFTDYINIKLYVWKSGIGTGEVPNDALLKEINVDLMDDYNKYLNLTKKYKMYSLEKKLKKAYSRIRQNYLVGLDKLFNYLMITDAYKNQNTKFILKLSNKLFETNKSEEAKTLIVSFVKYKLNKDMNFNIQPFDDLLIRYSYTKDANKLRKIKAEKIFEYAKKALYENSDFDITHICKVLDKLKFKNYSNDLKQLKITLKERKQLLNKFENVMKKLRTGKIVKIDDLVKSLEKYNLIKESKQLKAIYNALVLKEKMKKKALLEAKKYKFCSLEKMSSYIKVVDNFGNVKVRQVNGLQDVLSELSNPPITYTKKVKMMYYWSELLAKNKSRIERILSYDITNLAASKGAYEVLIKSGIQQGSLPSQLNINITNLQTKKGNIKSIIDIYSLAGAMWSYTVLTRDWDLFRDRVLILNAFLVSKGYPNLPNSCGYGSSGLVGNTLYYLTKLILQKHDRDAVKVVFLLVNNKFSKLDKFLLQKKDVKKLFDIAKKHYIKLTNAK